MAYYITFLRIPVRDGTRSKVTGNFLVNALHAFHRFSRRYHVKNNETVFLKLWTNLVYVNVSISTLSNVCIKRIKIVSLLSSRKFIYINVFVN